MKTKKTEFELMVSYLKKNKIERSISKSELVGTLIIKTGRLQLSYFDDNKYQLASRVKIDGIYGSEFLNNHRQAVELVKAFK